MEGELQDWEVLQSSGSTVEDNNSKSLEEIEDDTLGMISFNYFSLENNSRVCRVEAVGEDVSFQSGSPVWIEPSSDTPYGPKHSSELWSDSSSDRLEDQILVDDDVDNKLGLENSGRSDENIVEYVKRRVDKEEYSKSIAGEKHLEEDWLGSSGEMDLMKSDEGNERKDESSLSGELITGNDPSVGEGKSISIVASVKSGGEKGDRGYVWWKIPIELLKYCVFRVNPIWSFSMAAAVVGFVMLGRRLYNMKNKSRTLQLKVLLDDKKVVNHAARWNEAISVVKRLPIIRPAFPSSVGMNQWSMMSLR